MKLDVSDVLYDSSSVSSDSGTSQSSRVSHDFLSSIANSSILPSNVSTGRVFLSYIGIENAWFAGEKADFSVQNMATYAIFEVHAYACCVCVCVRVCARAPYVHLINSVHMIGRISFEISSQTVRTGRIKVLAKRCYVTRQFPRMIKH